MLRDGDMAVTPIVDGRVCHFSRQGFNILKLGRTLLIVTAHAVHNTEKFTEIWRLDKGRMFVAGKVGIGVKRL